MAIPQKKKKSKLPSLDNQETNVNKQLAPLDEVFSNVDVTDALEEEEVYIEEKAPIPKREQSIESKIEEGGHDDDPFFKDVKNKKYIDKKNKQIVPIGGTKAKIKDKDLDFRKNILTGLKVFRLFVYLVIIFLVGLGIKNTYFPEQIYTNQEIEALAQQAVGETGFPTKRGEAFGKEYLKQYLTLTSSKSNKQLLSRVTTGETNTEVGINLGRSNANFNMKPLDDPILFESIPITDYSAMFKYSVYMSSIDGRDVDDEGLLTGHWFSFAVSVYYDKAKDSLSLIEPPVMIPTYVIRQPNNLPMARELGNGDADTNMDSVLQPTINGFIKAFANVTVDNNDEIVQYIPNNRPIALLSGFGGTVRLRNGESSIIRKVYKTNDPKEWKVDLVIDWQSTLAPRKQAPSFTSHYVMTIKKTDENVYLVTKFAPYIYLKK